ncbi:MAG: hypothetical protein J7641_01825 [Cyanobacteria bacterium SID2]|nr:hypothetical protein [Cyanobacteria bacterium SID2]MBP0003087.1 hypothetical protein [Cyanobacteria bacterium SBC]
MFVRHQQMDFAVTQRPHISTITVISDIIITPSKFHKYPEMMRFSLSIVSM